MFDTLLPYLLAGISVGGQYAMIAVGYTLVYGILRLINFAHGDIFTAAGFFMIYLTASLPISLSIPLVILLTVALGFIVERVAYKPLRSAPRMSIMISAIGVSYLLQNLMWYITGGLAKQYPVLPFLSQTIRLGSAATKLVTIVTPLLTIGLVVALVMLINHTKIGMAMRAVSVDFETSQLMGIKINSVISVTFIIGSAMAAIGSAISRAISVRHTERFSRAVPLSSIRNRYTSSSTSRRMTETCFCVECTQVLSGISRFSTSMFALITVSGVFSS